MLEFGDFQLDPDRRELLCDGQPLAIQAKLFDTLVYLAENHDRVVEKQELLESVWPDSHVEESTLFQTISALRKALSGGKADGARYIATVPGRGYRFVAPLKSVVNGRVARAAGGSTGVIEIPIGPAARERRPPPSQPDVAIESEAARRPRSSIVLLAALATVAAVAVAFWLDGRQTPAPSPLRRFSIEFDHAVGEAVISPNGRYVAYTRCRSAIHGFGSLWVRDLETGKTTNLVEEQVVRHVCWSPDSDFVAFGFSDGPRKSFQKAAVPGGPRVKLCDLERGLTGAAWSPDGDRILLATPRPGALHAVPARGGRPSLLVELTGNDSEAGIFHPTWLPGDSNAPAIVASQGNPHGNDVQDLNLMLYRPGSGLEPLKLGRGFAPSYAPTGHLVYFEAAGRLAALPFSMASMSATGGSFPVSDAPGPQGPSVARDGTLAYVRVGERGREQLVWRDRAGRKLKEVGRPQYYVNKPELSPDGLRVVTIGGDRWGEALWIQDSEGTEASRLTFAKHLDFAPTWSPDGSEILFRSDRSGAGDIYVRRSDGSGEARKVYGADLGEQPQDWSPDGRYLLFNSNRAGVTSDVFYLERTGAGEWSEPRPFLTSEHRESAATFSPDGRLVAYVSNETGRDEVYVKPFPSGDGKWQISKNGGTQPRWNPGDSELFYVERDALMAVSVGTKPTFSTGSSKMLFRDRALVDGYAHPTYDVSADGRRFIMVDWTANPKFSIEIVQNWYEEFRGRSRR